MAKISTLIFLLLLFICITGKSTSVEARTPVKCSENIDCKPFCNQAFLSCCAFGQCICEACPPPLNHVPIIQSNYRSK
ncbi:Nodule Cysteine-Rich (NCR) secreted peptide-like protein [Medicago truncatula]|uniref:Nodule Cysteine-Rich (NCR) secreted peptide-like protein n=1 Tax=Medicago truncatula TaxID=3880 RepID=A0A072UE15_MEDTR|nr:Nodule Cysteine-Rich (NCR) secreted peptide-like protein [Medicago truncatula]